ncbi:hypothetical protein [Burkholderia sp. Leaf177]|uniref:hypothetical protein n=1 Tax=Burkholderia sp. Leaf177 TaxID=1736287 RepID=UPI0006F6BE17|nr:hypothetical protein [Burkholderia sp. Leaf177]
MPKKLPHFAAVDLKEMRRFWKQYRGNEDIERLLLEIQHNRNLIHELEDYFQTILKVWQAEGRGQLVAMEKTRLLYMMERSRFGNLQGLYVPTNRRGEEDPEAMEMV